MNLGKSLWQNLLKEKFGGQLSSEAFARSLAHKAGVPIRQAASKINELILYNTER